MKIKPPERINVQEPKENAHSSNRQVSAMHVLEESTPAPKDLSAHLTTESKRFDMSKNTETTAQKAIFTANNAVTDTSLAELIAQGWTPEYDPLDQDNPLMYLYSAQTKDKYMTAEVSRDVTVNGEIEEERYTLYLQLGGLHEVEVLWAYVNKAVEWFNWVAPPSLPEIPLLPPLDRNNLVGSFAAGTKSKGVYYGLSGNAGLGDCCMTLEVAEAKDVHREILFARNFFAAAGGQL